MGTVYLLHFEKPIGNSDNPRGQAQHYLGYTDNLKQRIERHKKGWSSSIVRAFHAQHITFTVARTWEADRTFERHLKTVRKNNRELCPICRNGGNK